MMAAEMPKVKLTIPETSPRRCGNQRCTLDAGASASKASFAVFAEARFAPLPAIPALPPICDRDPPGTTPR